MSKYYPHQYSREASLRLAVNDLGIKDIDEALAAADRLFEYTLKDGYEEVNNDEEFPF